MCSGVDWFTLSRGDIKVFEKAAVNADPGNKTNPLWVIRAYFDGDLLPGKLDVDTFTASVPYQGKAEIVGDFKVALASADTILWVANIDGNVPSNAILGGKEKCSGEILYIGRAEYEGQMIPGKVQTSQGGCFIPVGDSEIKVTEYDVLCRRGGC